MRQMPTLEYKTTNCSLRGCVTPQRSADQLRNQVYSRLMGDLINTVKARAAGRLEGSRLSFKDLLLTPEFIFEETSHQEHNSESS